MALACNNRELNEIIKGYFHSGRQYNVILKRLKEVHGVRKSLTWLKLRVKSMGLSRKKYCDDDTVKVLICKELRTSQNLRGYRAMWNHIKKKYKVNVRRDVIMQILQEVDPDGVSVRKKKYLKRRIYHNKGPNYLWHMDGYDKLTPYGIGIHGCIDGFSRKLMWLKVTPTNHDPKVIARFYLESVEKVAGVPKFLRSDYGTENCTIAALQIAFNMKNEGNCPSKSYIYGPSKHNVRIEGWWSQLRRFKTSWWIEAFKDLKERNLFDGFTLHKYCLTYVTLHLIESELNEFMEEWNTHKIRANSRSRLPSGIPNDLYDMPSTYGVVDHIQDVDHTIWMYAMEKESRAIPKFYPSRFKLQADDLLQFCLNMKQSDINVENWESVYLFLINHMS